MSQKTYKYILQGGVYLALGIVFFVFKNLLFPFITSKQLPFNVLIEILMIFWVAMIVKYPEWRPKKNFVTFGLVAFMAGITISSFTGVDFNLSFWGDIERMLGVFHILHFLGLYLIIITVFREWKDWQIFFIASIVIANLVSIKGLTGKGYSTIGNTAYVSGYIIFNMYFAMILFFQEKSWAFKSFYLMSLPIMFFEFQKIQTSGAYVGLGFSILFVFFLYGVLSKDKRIKNSTLSIFLSLVVITVLLFSYKDSNFVSHNKYLRFATGITLQKSTFQTRLISWRAAIKDFKVHPLLGNGHGNFAITFDKYFDPSFYNYTRSETYFDRAHNNVLDIAATTGSVGILSYLFFLLAAAYYWVKAYLEEKIGVNEFIMVSGLMTAYFVQNLAVFDSFVTYFGLMMTLAFIYWRYQGSSEVEYNFKKDLPLNNPEIYSFIFASFILLMTVFQYNIKPWQMLIGTIEGQKAYAKGGLPAAVVEYDKALSLNTVLDRDSRTSLIRLYVGNPNQLVQIKKKDKETADKILLYIIEQAEKNVAYNERDSMAQMMLAQVYNGAVSYYSDDQQTSASYSDKALEHMNMAIAASPGRVPVYFQKAQVYITRGDKEKALETLEYAASLNEDYYDSYCNLAKTQFFFRNEDEGYKWTDQCLDKGGSALLGPANFVKNLINHYAESNDYERLRPLYEHLAIRLEPKVVDNWVKLANLYKLMGENDKAIEAAEHAGTLDPKVESYVGGFISELKSQE